MYNLDTASHLWYAGFVPDLTPFILMQEPGNSMSDGLIYTEPDIYVSTLRHEHVSIYDFMQRSSHGSAKQARKNINNLVQNFSSNSIINNKLISMVKSTDDLNFLSAYTELLAFQFFTDLGYEVEVLDSNIGSGIPDLVCVKDGKRIYIEVTSMHTSSGYNRFERQLFNKINMNLKSSDYTRSLILSGHVKSGLPGLKQSRIIHKLKGVLHRYNELDKTRTNSFGLPRVTMYCEHKCNYCTTNYNYDDYHKCIECYYLNCDLVPSNSTPDVPILPNYPLRPTRSPVHERIIKKLRDKSKSQYKTIPSEHPFIIVLGLYDNICLNSDLDIMRALYGYDRVDINGLIPYSITKFASDPGRWICREGHYIHSSTAGVLVFNNTLPHLTDIDYTFYANPGNSDKILEYPGFDELDTKYVNESDFTIKHKQGFNFSLDVL